MDDFLTPKMSALGSNLQQHKAGSLGNATGVVIGGSSLAPCLSGTSIMVVGYMG